jgi:hypothetical protein
MFAVAIVLAASRQVRAADETTDLPTYARNCYKAVGVAEAEIGTLDCRKGQPLPVFWTDPNSPATHINLDQWSVVHPTDNWPDTTTRITIPSDDFPKSCDYPAWLTDKCYGHSYIQVIPTKNRDVKAVMMCRHKKVWNGWATNFGTGWVADNGSGQAQGPVVDASRFRTGDTVYISTDTRGETRAIGSITGNVIKLTTTTTFGGYGDDTILSSIDGWVADVPSDWPANGATGPVSPGHRFVAGDSVTVNFLTTFLTRSITTVAGNTITFDQGITPKLPAGAKVWVTDGDKTFDDIAVIIHNSSDKNGNTCWFQSKLGRQILPGRMVPAPTATNWSDVWLSPTGAASQKCYECHDNGPFLTSYWIQSFMQSKKIRDKASRPYRSYGAAFTAFNKIRFVNTIIDPPGGAEPCTDCHRIAARTTADRGNCSRWMDWATGGGLLGNLFPAKLSEYGKGFPQSFWMPLEVSGIDTFIDWTNTYRSHIESLRTCCTYQTGAFCNVKSCTGNVAFPGKTTGCVPLEKNVTRCELKVATLTTNLQKSIVQCHRARAGGRLVDDVEEEACESAALAKLDDKAAKLKGCVSCTAANLSAIKTGLTSFLDTVNGQIYCAGTVPLGGDDSGFVPPDSTLASCEDRLARATAVLLTDIGKCRQKMVKFAFDDDPAAKACEAKADAKLDKIGSTLAGCPPCADLAALKTAAHDYLDPENGLVYCASPSGAFVDGAGQM